MPTATKAAGAVPRVAVDEGRERHKRAEAWGPWSISPIYEHDVHVGFGPNCHKHKDCPHQLDCSRSIRMGKKNRLSEAECIRRCKEWLVIGWHEDWGKRVSPRTAHCTTPRDLRKGRMLPDWSDADLDSFAQEALAGQHKTRVIEYCSN